MATTLREFRSLLREYSWICERSVLPGQFQVLDIFCYIADKTFLKTLTPPYLWKDKTSIFLFDIVITDGLDKQKCFLALPLGQFVLKQMLKIGDYITLESVRLCYLEGEFGDRHIVTYILIEAMQIIETANIAFPPLHHIDFLDSNNPRERECRPLVTGRRYYIHVWSPSFVFGPLCTDSSNYILDPDEPPPINFCVLSDFDENWQRIPAPYPALLLRILSRSKVHQYGSDDDDKMYPFVSYIIAGDGTSNVNLVLFNRIAISGFYALLPGSIVLLENYTLCKRRDAIQPTLNGMLAVRVFSPLPFEIILNDHTRLKIVPEDCPLYVNEILSLPRAEFAFAERATLPFIVSNTKVDIVGLITFSSSFYRVPYKLNTYLVGMWLEVIDSSSYLPFRVFIFVDPNRMQPEKLRPGKLVACTQIKVMHAIENEVQNREEGIFLCSSVSSEIYVNLSLPEFLENDNVRKMALMIRDHPEEMEFLRNNVLRCGGFFTFPKMSRELADHDEGTSRMPRKLLPGAYWNQAFEDLSFREKKRVLLGGFILDVEFVDYQTVDCPDNIPSVYGWSYASNVRTRRLLYRNLGFLNHIRGLRLLNGNHFNKFMFPLKYSATLEDEVNEYLKFPAMNADSWTLPPAGTLDPVPANIDGFYLITVASLHFQALIQCVFIPEPAQKPHPSFVDLLSGQFEPLPLRPVRTFIGEPPRYTLQEVKKVRRTVSEVANRTFLFIVDFYRQGPSVKQAVLYRAFYCPPDQLSNLMDADQREPAVV